MTGVPAYLNDHLHAPTHCHTPCTFSCSVTIHVPTVQTNSDHRLRQALLMLFCPNSLEQTTHMQTVYSVTVLKVTA